MVQWLRHHNFTVGISVRFRLGLSQYIDLLYLKYQIQRNTIRWKNLRKIDFIKGEVNERRIREKAQRAFSWFHQRGLCPPSANPCWSKRTERSSVLFYLPSVIILLTSSQSICFKMIVDSCMAVVGLQIFCYFISNDNRQYNFIFINIECHLVISRWIKSIFSQVFNLNRPLAG